MKIVILTILFSQILFARGWGPFGFGSKDVTKATTTTDQPECPEERLPQPGDCGAYLECFFGSMSTDYCSLGEHFNPISKECEPPCDAHCDSSLACKCNWPECGTENIPRLTTVSYATSGSRSGCTSERLPKSGDCEAYLECSDGAMKQKYCPGEDHFNPITKKCELPCEAHCDSSLACACGWSECHQAPSPQNKSGCVEGLYPYPNHCDIFIHCSFGQECIKECEEGLHFNRETKRCEAPCLAKCDQNMACRCGWSTCESKDDECDDGLYEISDDCETFNHCSFGQSCTRKCPKNKHFDKYSKRCVSVCDAECDPSLACQCGWDSCVTPPPTQCIDGLYPNPKDCRTFYECAFSQSCIKNCSKGYHFNAESEECEPPCQAKCDQNLACECDWKTCDSGSGSEEEEECTDGLHPIEGKCGSFRECLFGSSCVKNCDNGQQFNKKTRRCESPCSAHCDASLACDCDWDTCERPISSEPTCTEGLRAHEENCDSFYQCSFGQECEKKCPEGMHFSEDELKCLPICDAHCDPSLACKCGWKDCETHCKDGVYPLKGNCSSFIHCSYNQECYKKCPEGLHFSEKDEKCLKPCDAHCDPDLACKCNWPECDNPPAPTGCKDGVYPNENDCTTFYHCSFNQKCLKKCDQGLHFSKKDGKCLLPCNAHCDSDIACKCGWETCGTNNTSTRQPSPYPPSKKPGTANTSTQRPSPSPPSRKPVTKRPSTWEPETPRPSPPWIPGPPTKRPPSFTTVKTETPGPPPTKNPSKRTGCVDGLYPHETDCTLFYHCSHNQKCVKKCGSGFHFSKEQEKCVLPCSARCNSELACLCGWPSCYSPETTTTTQRPQFCKEGLLYPNPDDCQSYRQCSLGRFFDIKCPQNHHFNKKTQKCEPPCDAHCNPDLACECKWPECVPPEPNCKDGFYAHEYNCSNFYQCSFGTKCLKTCRDGKHFSDFYKDCVLPCHAGCDPNLACKCGWPSCTTTTTTTTTTQKPKNCIEDKYPDPNNCGSYFECVHGKEVKRYCNRGLHFNKETKVCEHPCDAYCDQNFACQCGWPPIEDPPCKEGNVSIPNSCLTYKECFKGKLLMMDCPYGYHFSSNSKRCELPCAAHCDKTLACECGWPTCEKPSGSKCYEGEYRNKDRCDSYEYCYHGEWYEQRCSEGQHFNIRTYLCEDPCVARCDNTLACECGWDIEPDPPCIDGKYPNLYDCAKYYLCFNHKWLLMECEGNLHFSQKSKQCEPPCRAHCDKALACDCGWPSCKSPKFNCTKDGWFKSPLGCRSAVKCKEGVPYFKRCDIGLHFNVETQLCEYPCNAYCEEEIACVCEWQTCTLISSDALPVNARLKRNATTSTQLVYFHDDEPQCSDGMYSNPDDCGTYIKCLRGQPHTAMCPRGKHFDSETETCEDPCDAHCDLSLACQCGWSECGYQCPESNGEFGDVFDCTIYYLCKEWKSELKSCRKGYAFDYVRRTCVLESEANCMLECNEPSQIQPHPQDCTKYIKCINGIPNARHCPRGKRFDSIALKCSDDKEIVCQEMWNEK